MRVGIFHSSLPEPNRKLGGVELVAHRLGNELVERGHEVVMCTHAQQAPPDAMYELRHVARRNVAAGRLRRLTIGSAALNGLRTDDLDVLNLHGDDWFYWRRRVPTVRTFHGSALREAQSATKLPRRILQSAVFLGELLASRLATSSYSVCAGIPRGYALSGYLPQGVVLAPSRDPVDDPVPRTSFPSILFVGTWDTRKRGRFLRDVFEREVLPQHPDAQLLMVTDECEETDHVRWIRHPDDGVLSHAYGTAWVFCLPSTYEGFGQPYVEAMAHRTPVVATPNPGSRYVSDDGRAALLVEDVHLGGVLNELLRDASRRESLAADGYERADAFGWDHACQMHIAAFDAAITKFSASRVPGLA